MSSLNFFIIGLCFFIITYIIYWCNNQNLSQLLKYMMLLTGIISAMFMVPIVVDLIKPYMILWVDY